MTTPLSVRSVLTTMLTVYASLTLAQAEPAAAPLVESPVVSEASVAPAQAPEPSGSAMEKVLYGVRLAVLTGYYDIDSERTVSNDFDPAQSSEFESDTGMVGGGIAGNASLGGFSAELSIEYTDIDRFSVTEAQLRLSRRVTPLLTLVGGGRVAQQGDGFAKDDIYREAGYLVGIGVGPLTMPFVASKALSLSGALTYNGSELDLPDNGGTPSADGLTASLRFTVQQSPWSALLRYRRFAFDSTSTIGAAVAEEDVTEQYLSAAIEYRWRL